VTDSEAAYRERPRRSLGRRLLTTLVVLVVVFGALLVVADRVGVNVAEQRIGDQVKQEVTSRGIRSSEPEVTVGGFPFLTQVLDGRYQSISIVLRNVEGEGVRLPRLDVEAHDVTATMQTLVSGDGKVVAKSVDGTATLSYASVADLIKQPGLTLAERDGKLSVRMPAQVLGQSLTLTGFAEVTAVKGKIRVRFDELTPEGAAVPASFQRLISGYAKRISVNVNLPALPYGLVVKEVQALPDGLAVTATASDVPITG
jgi:hypothetical protein